MKTIPSLSILFPCYNDAETIGNLVENAIKVAKSHCENIEVVVVDDASADKSLAVLHHLKKEHPHLKIISHSINRGYGATLRSGFQVCSKEYIFYTDGDGQYDVFELSKCIKRLTPNVDIVNGYKLNRADPIYRKVIGKIYVHFTRKLFYLKMRDINCDFRLMRTSLIHRLNLKSIGGEIGLELIVQAQKHNAQIVEVPVAHYPRRYGTSQFFNAKNIFKMIRGVIELKWNL